MAGCGHDCPDAAASRASTRALVEGVGGLRKAKGAAGITRRPLSTFGLFRLHLRLVVQDFLNVGLLLATEALDLDRRLLLEHVLPIELGHLLLLRIQLLRGA